MNITPKIITNRLLNLPKEQREWVIKSISPFTFRRWCGQSIHMKDDKERPIKLSDKIKRIMNGEEELSDLAQLELKDYNGGLI